MSQVIGLMDSGMGGLSVLKVLIDKGRGPILYMADTGRLPYGTRRPEEIEKFTLQAIDALYQRGAQKVIIACNTASAYGLEAARKAYPIPIEGVIEGAAEEAAKRTKKKKLLIMATSATINSGIYEETIHRIDPQISCLGLAADDLVLTVESGKADDKDTENLIKADLSKVPDKDYDCLVMACTHFPLARAAFERIFPPDKGVDLIDPAYCLDIKEDITDKELKKVSFFTSSDPEGFEKKSRKLLNFSGYELTFEKLLI